MPLLHGSQRVSNSPPLLRTLLGLPRRKGSLFTLALEAPAHPSRCTSPGASPQALHREPRLPSPIRLLYSTLRSTGISAGKPCQSPSARPGCCKPVALHEGHFAYLSLLLSLMLRSVRLPVNVCVHQETAGSLRAGIEFVSPVSVPSTEESFKNYFLNDLDGGSRGGTSHSRR